MSEKRFILKEMPYDDFIINDTVEDKEIYNNGVVDLLNEQQTIINEQNQRIRKLEDILKKFQFPVERVGE